MRKLSVPAAIEQLLISIFSIGMGGWVALAPHQLWRLASGPEIWNSLVDLSLFVATCVSGIHYISLIVWPYRRYSRGALTLLLVVAVVMIYKVMAVTGDPWVLVLVAVVCGGMLANGITAAWIGTNGLLVSRKTGLVGLWPVR